MDLYTHTKIINEIKNLQEDLQKMDEYNKKICCIELIKNLSLNIDRGDVMGFRSVNDFIFDLTTEYFIADKQMNAYDLVKFNM